MTAITAITAQNTVGVPAVHPVPPEMVLAQVRAVASDIGIDAIKVGMLGEADTIAAVARALDELPPDTPIVVDPVMVAESGAELLEPKARQTLIEMILPRATVLTPNLPEAHALTGLADASQPDLARAVKALGPKAVVVTGGHSEEVVDVFFDGTELVALSGERHLDGASHGSGCTHSAALAAGLAWGLTPLDAARLARDVAGRAVRDGLAAIGAGPGPVDVLGIADRAPAVPLRAARPLT
jgi:hydroxymethylpyrimidine/phosphomethylpyrimidine kinase